ncbi:MAG: hypothetical protein IPP62_17920 [bacterium]|nr:hypothetical protein [bacterium]
MALLERCIAQEFIRTTPDIKGDYKPLVFILTDGDPTDDWQDAARRVKTNLSDRRATVVAVACGPDANASNLRLITDDVLQASQLTAASIAALFRYMSASVVSASQAVGGGASLAEFAAEHIKKAEPGSTIEPSHRATSQAFLHARCVRDRRFYVMRFAAQPKASLSRHELENYYGVAAHLVEQFDHEATHKLRGPSFSASQLHNSPPCPSCGNSLWCFCSCGRIHRAPRPRVIR